LLCALVLPPAPVDAQVYFGKNKVRYDRREWQTLRTARFEILFYPEEEGLAREAAAIAESTGAEYDSLFGGRPSRRIPILLYSSHQAFQQSNAAQASSPKAPAGSPS
jgi:hypothetical protein